MHARVAAGQLRAFAQLAADLDVPLPSTSCAAWGDTATCAIPLANVPDWGHCSARASSARCAG